MTERITLSQLQKMQEATQDRRRVRGTVRTMVDGIKFDSKREAARWSELRLLERAGKIRDLRRQVPFDLKGALHPILTPTGLTMQYRADFVYFDKKLGCEVIEDAKGFCTEVAQLKLAVLAAQGVEVVLV